MVPQAEISMATLNPVLIAQVLSMGREDKMVCRQTTSASARNQPVSKMLLLKAK